jgi:hypothetical protein
MSGHFTKYVFSIIISFIIEVVIIIIIIIILFQGKIKELELQVEQLQRVKESKRPKTGASLAFQLNQTTLNLTFCI